jgi:hypothetical protein
VSNSSDSGPAVLQAAGLSECSATIPVLNASVARCLCLTYS